MLALRPVLAAALGSALLLACASAPEPRVLEQPMASAADPAGRITGYQYARSYEDVVRVDGRPQTQRVEYGFDYQRGVTVRRIHDLDGKLLSETLLDAESLRANAAERARMQELVATHPELGPLMDWPDLLIHDGGFVVREPDDPYCSTGSRCLRYIVTRGDGSIPHIHAVVDLVSDRVVYPTYDDTFAIASADKEEKKK